LGCIVGEEIFGMEIFGIPIGFIVIGIGFAGWLCRRRKL